MDKIEDNNLKNDYINAFNHLTKSKYSSIKFYMKNNSINFLIELINIFNKIKKLIIENIEYEKVDKFFKDLFSFEYLKKLEILKLKMSYKNNINSNLLLNLNDLKLLKELELNNFEFKNIFILKLNNLKKLYIKSCVNISLDNSLNENCNSNLKELEIEFCKNIKSKNLLKLPELEQFKGNYFNFIDYDNIFNSIIDFTSLKKLKKFIGDVNDFLLLESFQLNELNLTTNINNNKLFEKRALEKILTYYYSKLKEIFISLYLVDNNDILAIPGENLTVEILNINWHNEKSDCILYDLQNKFPNITNLNISHFYNILFLSNKNDISSNIKIIENPKSKVTSFSVTQGIKNTEFYCQSYKNLISANISLKSQNNQKLYFPCFNKKCDIIFNYLNLFFFLIIIII